MMPKIMTWLLFTGLMLWPPTHLAAQAEITVTQAQDGREIALKVGDILRIELPGSGGTGYSWFVELPGAPCLRLLDQSTQVLKEGLPGSPVLQGWRFRAEQPGATALKMAYYRPWEGVGQAVEHFGIRIRID